MAVVFEDRVSSHPNRYKVTPTSGDPYYVILERADEPTVVGTPLNAETLNYLFNETLPLGVRETKGGATLQFWYGTQAEYDALTTKNTNMVYVISDDSTIKKIQSSITDIVMGNTLVGAANRANGAEIANKAQGDLNGREISKTYGVFSGTWTHGVSGSLTLPSVGTYQLYSPGYCNNTIYWNGYTSQTIVTTVTYSTPDDGSEGYLFLYMVHISSEGLMTIQRVLIRSLTAIGKETVTGLNMSYRKVQG